MAQLRPVTPRPEIIVGAPNQPRLEDPGKTQVGFKGSPLGRERCVFALPTNGSGPVLLAPLTAAQGSGALVADPSGNVVGASDAVWVHRILYARFTEDTRRLG